MKFSNTAKRTCCSSSSQDQTAIAPHMTFGWLVGRQHRSTEMQLVDPPPTPRSSSTWHVWAGTLVGSTEEASADGWMPMDEI